ncbi:MAG: hypothetical protein GXY32_11615 [Ruminococcaceae bacterium]|nr:hypothetical protein [Oscillospiraceae bacterium]
MTIKEIINVLSAEVLTHNEGADFDKEVLTACGSDMMSDVLAYVKDQGLLLTGLSNPQAVRTASMMDMCCVVFVRGKRPDDAMLKLAEQLDITLLATPLTMFTACGVLYENGLRGSTIAEFGGG